MIDRGECRGSAGLLRFGQPSEGAQRQGRLEALEALVPFERFRTDIEVVVRLTPEERKSNAGRKPFDAVMMFKILVLQTLYNLADEQVAGRCGGDPLTRR
jgi:hypothetical protein